MQFKDLFQEVMGSLTAYIARSIVALTSGIIGILSPMVPFVLICTFAVLIDSYTAYRLSGRVRAAYPKRFKDSKAKYESKKANKIFGTLMVIYLVIALAFFIDDYILPFMQIYLANFISAAFCGVQLWSIFENESSCNGAKWAKVAQRIMVDKTSRHLDIDLESVLEDKRTH